MKPYAEFDLLAKVHVLAQQEPATAPNDAQSNHVFPTENKRPTACCLHKLMKECYL